MGDKINNGMGFQNIGISNCCQSSSGMSSMSINPYFSSAWDDDDDPVVTLNQHHHHHHQSVGGGEFNYQQGISSSYPPAADSTSYVQLLPKFPNSYVNGSSFSDMVGSFGLTDSSQIPNTISNYNNETTDHHLQSREEAVVGAASSPYGIGIGRRRKRMPADSTSPYHDPNKNTAEEELQKDPKEQYHEKKSTSEQNHPSKSHSGETPKQNYIHVRARRGQATNSHSLAERVRREKISERMRLLQELVPGCNKITGKAVMLDEIINYVQSLQQQVEFLSMKLATVNPELNIDIDRILSKDILHSRGRNAAIIGLNPGMNSHPYSHGFFPASIQVVPNTNQQFAPHVHHNVFENDLQNLLQMGFQSSSAMDNLGPKDD